MLSPILVTTQEYYAIGFAFTLVGLFYTAIEIFRAPHEREE